MNKKIIFLFAAIFSVGCVLTALAQSQAPAQTQTPSQSVPPDLQSSALDGQGGKRYLIGPGDLLDVRVFGQSDLNSTVEIDADGNITSLPFLEEPIPARCRNEKEVQKSISEAYAKYLVKPRVSVRILERRSRPPAVVFGAVRSPTRVQMMRKVKLHELLATAGGITANASGTIQVVHTEAEMCAETDDPAEKLAVSGSDIGKLEIYGINDVKGASSKSDPYIRPGDIVIVTEGEPIYITGAVVAPHEIVLKENLTLQRAIAMAGGPVRLAKTSEVHIYRQKDGKIGSEDLKFNYDAIKKGQQPDVLLQAYDIIDVRAAGALSGKSIADLLLGIGRGTAGFLPTRIVP
jgi:polysaccharide export outer membrane protein